MSLNQELREIDSLLVALKAKREIVLKKLEESEPEAKQMCLEGTQENVVDSALHGVLKKVLLRYGDIHDICCSSKAFNMQKQFVEAIKYEGGEVNEFIQRLVVVDYEVLIGNFYLKYYNGGPQDTHVITFGFKEGDKAYGVTFSMGFNYFIDREEFYAGYFVPAGAVEDLKEDLKQPLSSDCSNFYENELVGRAFGYTDVQDFRYDLRKLCLVVQHIRGFGDAEVVTRCVCEIDE
eukprot:TRINITY_DN150_c0_g1_i2.p1 TRINITY_DN150_c0_g1~~TRINITY_DN150_c0_g1_i2.p1  ORF type:complete len:256 (-),score=52.76 TRINITY_DN150_c0_g1_i2:423-1127(-)